MRPSLYMVVQDIINHLDEDTQTALQKTAMSRNENILMRGSPITLEDSIPELTKLVKKRLHDRDFTLNDVLNNPGVKQEFEIHNRLRHVLKYYRDSDPEAKRISPKNSDADRALERQLLAVNSLHAKKLSPGDLQHILGIRQDKVLAKNKSPGLKPKLPIEIFMDMELKHLINSAKIFLVQLQDYLSRNQFFEADPKSKFEKIYQLRNDQRFMNLLQTNWQMSCHFLDKILTGRSHEEQTQLKNSRYRSLYILNNLRRELISDPEHRRILPMEIQQHFVCRLLAARSRRVQKPHAEMPVQLLVEGVVTKKIHEADLAGDIEIPEDIICPISGSLFVDPVKVDDGKKVRYFERVNIQAHIDKHKKHPFTREPLTRAQLQEAPEMKEKVRLYKEQMKKELGVLVASSSSPEVHADETPRPPSPTKKV